MWFAEFLESLWDLFTLKKQKDIMEEQGESFWRILAAVILTFGIGVAIIVFLYIRFKS